MTSRGAVTLVATMAVACSQPADGQAAGPGTPLPPDIARVVDGACLSCHGDPPTSSAPQSLANLEAWRAPSMSEPNKSNGELAIERMKDGLRPMPPMGAVEAVDLDTIEAWVAAGMPEKTRTP